MPFLKIHVSVPVSPAQETELKSRIGQAIEAVPGKSEGVLLLQFADRCHLWLGGSSMPIAYIEAAVFANPSHAGYPALSACLARILWQVLSIPPENCYIKYEDISAFSVGSRYLDPLLWEGSL